MPKWSRGLLTAVQSVDTDALHAIIQEYRRNPCDRPPFEEALCSAVSLGCIDVVRLLLRVKVQLYILSRRLWNSFPIEMKKTCCLVTFERLLKTHLF